MFRFLAIHCHMGVVDLPAKEDCWKTEHDFWPTHAVISGLPFKRYRCIWKTIYLSFKPEVDIEEPDIDLGNLEDKTAQEEPTINSADQEREVDPRWCRKAAPLAEAFIDVSQQLCKHLGHCLSVDEMMKLFKGRSGQMHCMKKKPVKEGYKFFAICDAQTGYIWNIIPDGRLEKSTIHDTVMALVNSLPRKESKKYIVGMDNYFTFQKVMTLCRGAGFGVVGTACARRGWPPKEFKDIKDDRFNTFYLLKEEQQLSCRWVDNNVVAMVSTIHTGREKIARARCKPRPTNTNRNHSNAVWGSRGVTEIEIPGVIDDYNHWMGGVDKADQLIAHCRPSLRS